VYNLHTCRLGEWSSIPPSARCGCSDNSLSPICCRCHHRQPAEVAVQYIDIGLSGLVCCAWDLYSSAVNSNFNHTPLLSPVATASTEVAVDELCFWICQTEHVKLSQYHYTARILFQVVGQRLQSCTYTFPLVLMNIFCFILYQCKKPNRFIT